MDGFDLSRFPIAMYVLAKLGILDRRAVETTPMGHPFAFVIAAIVTPT